MNPKTQKDHDDRIRTQIINGLGPEICAMLDDPTVIEIMLNDDGYLWAERLGQDMERFGQREAWQAEALMGIIASTVNDTITRSKPILECELLLDGSRFEALIPPVVAKPTFTIRKRAIMVFTLENYVEQGIMTQYQRALIECAVHEKQNIFIVGGTGSGKTTLTNAVIRYMAEACPKDRLVILEDTRELQCVAENKVFLRSGEHADMTRLLKATMRLRPDRILVGEVRDGAALALLKAWNTGHPGGVATGHANNARSGLTRLEQLVGEATLSPAKSLIGEAIDMVICIEKFGGGRRIEEILKVEGYDGQDYITESLGG